jgi:hypothetical protein
MIVQDPSQKMLRMTTKGRQNRLSSEAAKGMNVIVDLILCPMGIALFDLGIFIEWT